MIRKKGEVYDRVRALLRGKGWEANALDAMRVARLGGGTDHLVLFPSERDPGEYDIIGEYNQTSKFLILYKDIIENGSRER